MNDRAIDLWTSIDECGLSSRARNALANEGFRIIGQVVERMNERPPWGGINALLRIPNLGKQSASEIMDVVRPLLSQLPEADDPGFLDWCRRNRLVLEMLRQHHWHDPDFDEI